jgi:AP-3 complex subunit delta-1
MNHSDHEQVNRSNIQSIIQQLLSYLVKETLTTPDAAQSLLQSASSNVSTGLSPNQSPAYRLVLSQRILAMGSQGTYEHITNFEWYLSVLVDLAHISNVDIGAEICDQLVDIAGRVRAARPYAVKLMGSLLIDDNLIRNAHESGSCSEVLWAAAWICGEYCEQVFFSLLYSYC